MSDRVPRRTRAGRRIGPRLVISAVSVVVASAGFGGPPASAAGGPEIVLSVPAGQGTVAGARVHLHPVTPASSGMTFRRTITVTDIGPESVTALSMTVTGPRGSPLDTAVSVSCGGGPLLTVAGSLGRPRSLSLPGPLGPGASVSEPLTFRVGDLTNADAGVSMDLSLLVVATGGAPVGTGAGAGDGSGAGVAGSGSGSGAGPGGPLGSGSLAFTGADLGALVAFALMGGGLGAALVAGSRRRRTG